MRLFLIIGVLLIWTNFSEAKDITITLTDDEYKAMSVLSETPEEWIQHAATNKARKMIEQLVLDNSDLQPSKISESEKKRILKDINVVKEREKRHGK